MRSLGGWPKDFGQPSCEPSCEPSQAVASGPRAWKLQPASQNKLDPPRVNRPASFSTWSWNHTNQANPIQSNSASWSHRSFEQSYFFSQVISPYHSIYFSSFWTQKGICSAGLSHIFEGRACCELEVMRSLLERRGTRAEFGRKKYAPWRWCWWVKAVDLSPLGLMCSQWWNLTRLLHPFTWETICLLLIVL